MLSGCYAEDDEMMVVRSAPPPEAAEVVAVSPGPDHVFIRGHWEWNGSRYVWKHGRYLRRPSDRAVWVEGHWQSSELGWFWQAGHWAEVQGHRVRAPRVITTPAPEIVEEGQGGMELATPHPTKPVPPAPTYMPPPPPASPPPPPSGATPATPQRYVAPASGAEY